MQVATLAGGCFWCTEAVFLQLKGVKSVVSGYTGGFVKNPCYREVCQDTTGHAEAVQITFDEKMISYRDLLEVFFATHDPTTINVQGYDVGTQYRSAIFYHDENQHKEALSFIAFINKQEEFSGNIVTQVEKIDEFYPAENDHQDFYNSNTEFRYCKIIIDPKIEKLKKHYPEKLK